MLSEQTTLLTITDIAKLHRSEVLDNLARKFAFGNRKISLTLSFNRSKDCNLLSNQTRILYSFLRSYWTTIAIGLESSRRNISRWNFFIAYCESSMVIDITYSSCNADNSILQHSYLNLKSALVEFDSVSNVTYSEVCETATLRTTIIYSALKSCALPSV